MTPFYGRLILFDLYFDRIFLFVIKMNFRERDICSIIFDKLPMETTSKSWPGRGWILKKSGVKLRLWWQIWLIEEFSFEYLTLLVFAVKFQMIIETTSRHQNVK